MNPGMKPFKGIIKDCTKVQLDKQECVEKYGPNKGYYYYCRFVGHPQFGTTGKLAGAHTSLVVKEYSEKGKKFVETLNSRYEKQE